MINIDTYEHDNVTSRLIAASYGSETAVFSKEGGREFKPEVKIPCTKKALESRESYIAWRSRWKEVWNHLSEDTKAYRRNMRKLKRVGAFKPGGVYDRSSLEPVKYYHGGSALKPLLRRLIEIRLEMKALSKQARERQQGVELSAGQASYFQ